MNQGDPRLVLGPDGSRLVFRGGQPVMDRGMENLVLISLFTSPGWCGNALLETPIGSDFEQACNQPITRQSLNEIRNAAQRALAIDLLGRVVVQVRNPRGYRLEVGIKIERTGAVLLLGRDGGTWRYQVYDPASDRLVPRQYGAGTVTRVEPADDGGGFGAEDIDFNITDWEFN